MCPKVMNIQKLQVPTFYTVEAPFGVDCSLSKTSEATSPPFSSQHTHTIMFSLQQQIAKHYALCTYRTSAALLFAPAHPPREWSASHGTLPRSALALIGAATE